MVAGYSRMLIDIYEAQGMHAEYKDELLYQIFSLSPRDLVYVKKLKASCTEDEWISYREKLLLDRGAIGIKFELLEEEKLYRRLLDEVRQTVSISNLDRYEEVLKIEYPEEVKQHYINYVTQRAKNTADRKSYRELVYYLEKISEYPGGPGDVLNIAESWKQEYSRRRAMMDELRKAGF